jgi:predicted ArsR family transcriptional regulator
VSTHPGGTDDEEQRIRTFIERQRTFSESAPSLANKLGVHPRIARRVLDRLVKTGLLKRQTFQRGIEPMYYRYPERDEG